MAVLMACSTTRNASAQYPDDEYYENYDDEDSYSDGDDYYDEPSETDVDMNVFVNTLSPYGRWINSPSYGQVWICNESGFTPYYTRGHWMYTNYGWTWASDYAWGWAPFHYGRWAYDPFYGWMWVPGYQWGPAWVGWRTGGDYYGWAPLSPGINISIGFGFGNAIPANNWCFVPRRYIGYSNFNHYVVNRSHNTTIIRNTTIINNTNVYRNTRYVTGPKRAEVERYTGRKIKELRVSNAARPGAAKITNNNTVNIYRPQINKKEGNKKEINKKEVTINKNQSNGGSPSHNMNAPDKNDRIIRTPERRTDNDNKRKPNPRDRINNSNGSNDHVDVNRNRNSDIIKDKGNDVRNRQPQNDNRPNSDRSRSNDNDRDRSNEIKNKPPQQSNNHFPSNRNLNNRNDQQNRQENKRPPSNWNNRNNEQNRNYGQRPDFSNSRNSGRTWQPSHQQQQRSFPRSAPQQENNRKKPA